MDTNDVFEMLEHDKVYWKTVANIYQLTIDTLYKFIDAIDDFLDDNISEEELVKQLKELSERLQNHEE